MDIEGLKSLNLFSALTDNELIEIKTKSKVREYKVNEIVFNAGEKCTTLNILLSGKLKVVKYSYSGKEKTINMIGEKQEFGALWLYANQDYPAHIICEKNAEVLMIEQNMLFEMFSNKEFIKNFLEIMGRRILNMINSVELLSIASIKKRIAVYLLREYDLSKSRIIELKISKAKMANELGTVREVISRNISEMEKEGYIKILSENSFEVLDIEKFENII